MLTEADLIAWDVEAVQLVEAHTALLAQAIKAGDVDGMVRHERRLLMCKPLLGMGEQYRRVLYLHSYQAQDHTGGKAQIEHHGGMSSTNLEASLSACAVQAWEELPGSPPHLAVKRHV